MQSNTSEILDLTQKSQKIDFRQEQLKQDLKKLTSQVEQTQHKNQKVDLTKVKEEVGSMVMEMLQPLIQSLSSTENETMSLKDSLLKLEQIVNDPDLARKENLNHKTVRSGRVDSLKVEVEKIKVMV